MDKKQEKRIIKIYKDLLHYYFDNKREMYIDDKPFKNLLDALYPVVLEEKFYSDGLFFAAVNWHLEGLDKLPVNIDESSIQDLLSHIKNIFLINKQKHFLVFPLQGSRLEQDIVFDRFNLLTQKEEKILIKQIASITGIEDKEVKALLTHTKRSRSKDFLKANIMIIEVENQTENVNDSAYLLAQYSIIIFQLIHIAFNMETSIYDKVTLQEETNRHVAIISKDYWRCSHGYSWSAYLQCRMKLDFMSKGENQEIFVRLLEAFTIYANEDDLTIKFVNSFNLYFRGFLQSNVQNDYALGLLLYITALETLVCDGRQEKRLRLAAILPKIIDIPDFKKINVSKTINDLYKERNNFVHAGKIPSSIYGDGSNLKLLERITALLLLKYLEVDHLLLNIDGSNRLDRWNKYLDNTFDNIIFG